MKENYLYTDDKIIIDSKTVLIDNEEQGFYVPLSYNNQRFGTIKIVFSSDKNNSGSIIKKVENDVLIVKCVKVEGNNNGFTSNPISLAQYNGKTVTIIICSDVFGNIKTSKYIRRVEYTIYMEK